MVKVNFDDCEFGCFEPHYEIEYDGKKYRAIDVDIEVDGRPETHTISELELEHELLREGAGLEAEGLDNEISFYAESNDGVYFIIEQIVGEEIV